MKRLLSFLLVICIVVPGTGLAFAKDTAEVTTELVYEEAVTSNRGEAASDSLGAQLQSVESGASGYVTCNFQYTKNKKVYTTTHECYMYCLWNSGASGEFSYYTSDDMRHDVGHMSWQLSNDSDYLVISARNGNYTADITYREYPTSFVGQDYQSENDVPWSSAKDTVSRIVWGSGDIPAYAFKDFSKVKTLEISDYINPNDYCRTVCSIGEYAFYGCKSLNLTYITTGLHCQMRNLVTIGDYAFCGCESLQEFYFSTSTKTIGDHVFDKCSALQRFGFDNCSSVATEIHPHDRNFQVYDSCLVKDNVIIRGTEDAFLKTDCLKERDIGPYAFYGCKAIKSLELSDRDPDNGVSISIGDYAFAHCINLKSITVNDNIAQMGNYVFSGCSALETVNWDSVYMWQDWSYNKIPAYCFKDCTSLKTVNIKDDGYGIRTICSGAFQNCRKLSQIALPEALEKIDSSAFSSSGLTELILPVNVTSVAKNAFSGCQALKQIDACNPNVSVAESAFSGCENVSLVRVCSDNSIGDYTPESFKKTIWYNLSESRFELVLNENCTGIGSYAFHNCVGLEVIALPDSLHTIGTEAFSGCQNLNSIVLPQTLLSLADNSFASEDNIEVDTPYKENLIACLSEDNILYKTSFISNNQSFKAEYIFGVLSISATDNDVIRMPDYSTSGCGEWKYLSSSTKRLVFSEDIQYIGHYNFRDFVNLEEIEFHNPDITFGYFVFPGNSNITIHSGVGKGIEALIINNGYQFQLKSNPANVPAPKIQSYTDDSVTLESIDGYEYKLGNGNWQSSSVFTGLSIRDTKYTFYQRIAKNAVYDSSASSEGVVFTKPVNPNIPDAPTVLSYDDTSVVLQLVPGCEYKVDSGPWQNDNIFQGLSLRDRNYQFYQRFAETNLYMPSKSSASLSFTKPGEEATPIAPEVSYYTENAITLKAVAGYEYRINNGSWQNSPVFSGLQSGTQYVFYQRIAETSLKLPSAVSSLRAFTTLDKPSSVSVESVNPSAEVTLTYVEGCEYSMDDASWQDSNVFTDVQTNSPVYFYARVKAVENHSCSSSIKSEAVLIAAAPTVEKLKPTSVRLTKHENYEYSVDNVSWSADNVLAIAPIPMYVYQRPQSSKFADTRIFQLDNGLLIDSSSVVYIEGIEISKLPDVVQYVEGFEHLVLDGGVITLHYSDSSSTSMDLCDAEIASYDNRLLGKQDIHVKYDDCETSFEITVVAKTLSSISISTLPVKTEYIEGQIFSPAGMVVTAYYDNGTNAVITNYTYNPSGELSTSDSKITVSYMEKGITKTVELAISVHKPYELSVNGAEYSFTVHDDVSQIKLIIAYYTSDDQMLSTSIREIAVEKEKTYSGTLGNEGNCRIFVLDTNCNPLTKNWTGTIMQ